MGGREGGREEGNKAGRKKERSGKNEGRRKERKKERKKKERKEREEKAPANLFLIAWTDPSVNVSSESVKLDIHNTWTSFPRGQEYAPLLQGSLESAFLMLRRRHYQASKVIKQSIIGFGCWDKPNKRSLPKTQDPPDKEVGTS